MNNPEDLELVISREVFKLLDELFDSNVLYRSTGVIFEDFVQISKIQLGLFPDEKTIKHDKLAKAIDNIEAKFGKNTIRTGFKS